MYTDKYQLVNWHGNKIHDWVAVELYDHAVDPNETTNIAHEQLQIVNQLASAYVNEMKDK